MTAPTDPANPDELTLPLLEEEVQLRTRERETGRVRVAIHVETREELVAAELADQAVEIERQPADELVDEPPATIEQDGVLIIPVIEEKLVLLRRYRITERILVRRVPRTRRTEVPVTLRREAAEIERLAPTTDSEADIPNQRTGK